MDMRKPLFTIFILLLVSFGINAQSKTERKIIKLLHDQDESWNRADIEGFMTTYWNNDSLMFIGKSGVTYGWKNTLSNYKKGYPNTEAMGKLNFNLIQIKRLSRKYYHVTGKWHLTRTVGDLQGHFTLLVKKMKGKWLIISDHSS
jgi:ketosteroid isomerase-like protein